MFTNSEASDDITLEHLPVLAAGLFADEYVRADG